MLDLEQSIAGWREKMVAAGIKIPVPLAELESHLRDEVDHLMRGGLSAKAAFETAVQRIGHANVLSVEFEKISPAGLPRRYLSIFCFCSAPLLVFVNIWALQPGEISPTARFVGLATMSLVALYVVGLPFLYNSLPSARNRLVQTAMWLGYIFAFLWPLAATFNAIGLIHLNVGIVFEMIIWSLGAAWFATWLAYGVCGRCAPPMVRLG